MVRVEVVLPGRGYPVLIGTGVLDHLIEVMTPLPSAVAVVTDDTVGPLWGSVVMSRLELVGVRAFVVQVPSGEASKSWEGLRSVIEQLEAGRVDRRAAVVALGGGVVGDLAGFAAAVWLRGLDWFQLPSTLLAMVDSSVGGKTAIDTPSTKNSVGAFWQPKAVIADVGFLRTLPDHQYRAAFAEIIKYAVTLDPELASLIRDGLDRLLARDPAALELVIARSVMAKAEVVTVDERESGWREVLNYGHTVGHALEVASGYSMAHGEAVAAGMRAAAWLSARMERCSTRVADAQNQLLVGFNLPGELPHLRLDDVMSAMVRDKKARAGIPKWVLLTGMGQAEVGQHVPEPLVREAVGRLLEGGL
ncbi:MAG TPA: 3-dehydroquinate synthase [Candidatus Dormibacteraeota bacterium]|nr:3-dehydroquinate synthase [Candidatus Dormibacteraeota bacterium]